MQTNLRSCKLTDADAETECILIRMCLFDIGTSIAQQANEIYQKMQGGSVWLEKLRMCVYVN
jgi:hypothetical protein